MNALEDEYFVNIRKLQVGHISDDVACAHLTMQSVQIAGPFKNRQSLWLPALRPDRDPWIWH